jgi:anti-anti-sigma factor
VIADDDAIAVTIVDTSLIDLEAVREFGEELYDLAETSGRSKIVLDCSNLEYIASAALNKLIVFEKKVSAAQGQLVLRGLTPAVREVFSVTRLNQKFNIE